MEVGVNMLRISVCEDDYRQRENIIDFLNCIIDEHKVSAKVIFDTGSHSEMLDFINTQSADLYILDIGLDDNDISKTGFELAKIIRNKSKDAYILFITAHPQFVFKAFTIKTFDYLNKPLNYEQFKEVFLNIVDDFENLDKPDEETCLVNIKIKQTTFRIKPSNIVYVEKIDINKIKVKLSDGSLIESHTTLAEIEESCCKKALTRTHKSFLCNAQYISSVNFSTGDIVMENGDKCLLGRTYKDDLKKVCDIVIKVTGAIVMMM